MSGQRTRVAWPAAGHPAGHADGAPTPAVLRVEGLTVDFGGDPAAGGVRAVDAASWELHRGRVTALVGESGSGKSATATAVLGLLPPGARVSGSVRVGGTEVVGAPPGTVRAVRGAVLGLVSQEPMGAWNPVLTVGAQVAEAVRAHARVPRRAAGTRVLELLAEAGLPEPRRVAGSYPHQLSGGQLQRAMIAMALAQDPVAVIADEPTTALDVTVQAEVLDVLRRLRDERETAVLLITHDMGVVADLADDVVVMSAGSVVERAPVGALFSAPRSPVTHALLAAVPHLGDGAGGRAAPPPRGAPAVELEHVRVVHPGRRGTAPVVAVDDVSLTVAPGEVLGLVGESGAGKSTLGQIVGGLLRPTAGRVRVDGVDLAAASRAERAERRRGTGVVFQDPASTLDPRWTVGRSVAEPLALHTRLGPEERRAAVRDLLELVRLTPAHAARYPHELSGGQRQRVAIARAVALGPRVLVADEPTSALDVSVQSRVLEVFRDLQAQLGFACLFVSHDLAVVERVADRVAVLQAGRLVEVGAAAAVLHDPQEAYTRRLLAAAPVADPARQARRRAARSGA